MKPSDRYAYHSFRPRLPARAMYCLLVFSLMAYGCRDSLAAATSEQRSTPRDASKRRGGEPPQKRQLQGRDQASLAGAPAANPLEVLMLAIQGNLLAATPSTDGATEAVKIYKRTFAIYQSMDMKIGMAASLFASGGAYYFLGQNREALNDYLEASKYSEESGFDAFLRPFLEASIGAAYAGLGESRPALERLNRALPMLRSANSPPFLALTLKALGQASVQIGQKRKALEYLSEARGLYQQTGTWQFEIQILTLMSALHASLGQPTEALAAARAAVDRAREKKDAAWEAQGHLAFGAADAAAGNITAAIAEYNLALQTFRAQRDVSMEATATNNLGLIYVARGEFDLALSHFQKALECFQSTGDRKMAGYALNNIGTIYYRRGEPLAALSRFEEALAIARQEKDERLKAAVLSSLADVYFLINRGEYALSLLKENAAAFKALEEPAHETESLISLADIYGATGRTEEGLDVLRQALASSHLADDPIRQGYILREMGHIYTQAGDRSNALKHYAAALAKLEAAQDVNGQVDVYAAMGTIAVADKDYRKAEEMYHKGLDLARAGGLRQSQMLILAGLGLAQEKMGNLSQAEDFYDQEIAIAEALRASAHIEELKTGIGNISAPLIAPAVLLKFKLGKWEEALDLVEKARARTFLDQMSSARIDWRQGAAPKLAGEEQSMRADIRVLEEKLRTERRDNPASEAVSVLSTRLTEAEEAHAGLLLRLKASNPEYARLQSFTPMPLKEVQRLLGPQATLVSYYVTADKTLAFVVRSDALQAVEIPVKEADLRAAIGWFRDFADLRDPQPESLKQLYAWLVAPIRPYLKTTQVILVPHGVLHYAPFAALTDGKRCFGEEHTITHLPSASTLPLLRRRTRPVGRRLLAVAQSRVSGLPSLRYVDEEARRVARLYNTSPLVTGRTTRTLFLQRAGAYNLLHIAAHAELNAVNPLFSRIRLTAGKGDSGAVEVREIYGLDLPRTDMVVLSACETQLGTQSKGDDIVGLSRAFIYAGAASLIASLWTVDDEATSLLMKTFYEHLRRGMSKAAALQAAQAVTRKRYPHPYYWAAFVLTGDPGR